MTRPLPQPAIPPLRPVSARRGRAAALAVAALALVPALITAPQALAHSGAPVTSPKSGAVLGSLPATVTLTFGDRLARVTGVQVLDAKGVNHAASARLDPRNAARVIVRTTRPSAGAYTVRWQVRSEDGHAESGTFSFRVRR